MKNKSKKKNKYNVEGKAKCRVHVFSYLEKIYVFKGKEYIERILWSLSREGISKTLKHKLQGNIVLPYWKKTFG